MIALIGVLHRGAGMALRGRITAYTAGGVTLLVLVSSLAVLDAERGAPGTPIHTYGEAVWWALATITTNTDLNKPLPYPISTLSV